jgi:serine/threonine-protein kinase RsbW
VVRKHRGPFLFTTLPGQSTNSQFLLLNLELTSDRGINMSIALHLPAQAAYASVARSMAATIAARCELTYDRVEDARLAIDEAFNQVITNASADAEVVCTFVEEIGAMEFMVQSRTDLEELLPTNTFSWTVLSALADEVHNTNVDGVLSVIARVQEPKNAAA